MILHVDPVISEYLVPYLNSLEKLPIIIEIGAHDGRTGNLLRTFVNKPVIYQAFEADPRNVETMRLSGLDPIAFAITNRRGPVELHLSDGITPGTKDRRHTDSSSIKRPTKHLEEHPWCRFEEKVRVPGMRLDDVCIPKPDLIWCDVQGAQLEVIEGGALALSDAHFFYCEVHPEPLYEGEPTLRELHDHLVRETDCPWVIRAKYPADVLFERVES